MATLLGFTTRSCTRLSKPRVSIHLRRAFSFSCVSRAEKVKIDAQQLWKTIHDTCEWGNANRWGDQPHETGMSRLSLDGNDIRARQWFRDTMEGLKCTVVEDAIGNQFAIRSGKRDGLPTYIGSHLDTQPTGGRYDGILGVCAGVEIVKALNKHDVQTDFPIGVINWTNEEGARFPKSMMGSGVWAGHLDVEETYHLQEVSGKGETVGEALQKYRLRSKESGITFEPVAASHAAVRIGAHFELHIEQGPRLQNARRKIGVVTGVQAYKWFDCKAVGRDCHTGTTPFEARADALLSASQCVIAANRIAKEKGALASTGIFRAFPGSVNTVPGRVEFSLDVRASTNELRDETIAAIFAEWKTLSEQAGSKVEVAVTETFSSNAVHFHEDCVRAVRESAVDEFGEDNYLHLVSGAGHDSVFTNMHAPTSMIFVPCKDGVSHHPEEYCTPEDCANGAQVLMNSVLRYDSLRASRLQQP